MKHPDKNCLLSTSKLYNSLTYDDINEHLENIVDDISTNWKEYGLENSTLTIQEYANLLKSCFKVNEIIIRKDNKVRSILWFIKYFHGGLLAYLKNNSNVTIEAKENIILISI
jgi:hypothetical protein